MPPQLCFFVSIAFGFIVWGIVTARYIWPELRLRQWAEALRPLLILHRFRFKRHGLVLIGKFGGCPRAPYRYA